LVDLQAAAAARLKGLKDKSDIVCAAADGAWSVVFHYLLADASTVNAQDKV